MDYLHLYGSNITTWGVKSIYCRISELDISTVIQWQTDDLMHTRLSIHTSPILSLSFSRHIYVHSTIYSHLLLIINNCVKLQMILHLPLFLGNNMSMWNLEIQSDSNILLSSICCIQNHFYIDRFDIYLTIIINNKYIEINAAGSLSLFLESLLY